MNPIHTSNNIFLRSILILSSHPRIGRVVRAVSFFREIQPKFCSNFSRPPCVLHGRLFLIGFVYIYYFIVNHITALNNFMQQSPPWEAGSRSATQEILRLLCCLKIRYHIHKKQITRAHTLTLILSYNIGLYLDLPNGLFLRVFGLKSSCALLILLISLPC
jgi:hypothetical protein